MLHIDYSLIPLSDDDREAIRRIVSGKLERGELPRVDRSHYGRVVVLNPDAVQTVHHIPDELRTPLRRTLLGTVEGSVPVGAERLQRDILDSEDPLYVLVIELESEFHYFREFVEALPALRQRYPDLGVFLMGRLHEVVEKLQHCLEPEGATLSFTYPDARGTIDISDPAELEQVLGERREPPGFSEPFFSQIRVQLGARQKPVPFNLDTLRRLHPHLGYGPVREIDMGGGRKEKEIIIDLPVRLIRDLQFRQDRGLDFHGVRRNGYNILSRNFDREKLEFRWIPLRSLEAFLRKEPGKEMETISLAQVQALRINTFNGQVSFVMKEAGDQISLDDVESVTLHWPRPRAQGQGGAAAEPLHVPFDRVILSRHGANPFDALHEGIREHYYSRLLLREEEQRAKLEHYTQRLNVGAVGPLAGQTLKLLRGYGLERLIHPESFHYLCDTTAQLPEYHLTAERFEQRFQELLGLLRGIASVSMQESLRVNDITHRMPVITEWIDRDTVHLEQATSSELEAAYREVKILIDFIDHEFLRNFNVEQEDASLFRRFADCQKALMTARWLADYKRGAYGPAFAPGVSPDFVFFGTPEDKQENDKHYFLPGLACSELFAEPANKRLFARNDYAFSVFLEEQLALAGYASHEEQGEPPGLQDIEAHLDGTRRRAGEHLEALRAALEGIDLSGSPEYQRLLKDEEQAYHERYRQFFNERDQVIEQHREAEQAFQDTLLELGSQLELPAEPDPRWLEGEEPDPAVFSTDFVAAARRGLEARQGSLARRLKASLERLRERAGRLEGFSSFLHELLQAHHAWQSAETAHHLQALAADGGALAAQRVNAVKRLEARQLETYRERIASQLGTASGELQQAQARVELRYQKNARALQVLRASVARLNGEARRLGRLERPEALEQELEHIVAFARRLGELSRSVTSSGTKMAQDLTRTEEARHQLHRIGQNLYKVQVEQEALDALADKRKPGAPPPPRLPRLDGARADRRAELGETFAARRRELDERVAALQGLSADSEALEAAQDELARLLRFEEGKIRLEKLSARKIRLRGSVFSLQERMEIMDAELVDLPRRVEERFMPARKELLLHVFIPEAERTLQRAEVATGFVREMAQLSEEQLKRLYLDRAVFRPFGSRQFLTGANIALNTQSPAFRGLQNVTPSLNLWARTLKHNYGRKQVRLGDMVKQDFLRHKEPQELWELIQQLHALDRIKYGYLVVPGTYPVEQAVRLMNHKDRLYNGLPRLVLLYLGKFDTEPIRTDARLREAYFRALRHNIVVNIDNAMLVDNPKAIAERLLHESLGSCFDFEQPEELPEAEEESQRAFRSRA